MSKCSQELTGMETCVALLNVKISEKRSYFSTEENQKFKLNVPDHI